MSDICVTRSHHLKEKKARELIEQLAAELVEKHGGNYQWDDNTICYKTLGVDASVSYSDDEVEVNVKLGLLMKGLKNILKKEIENGLDSAIENN